MKTDRLAYWFNVTLSSILDAQTTRSSMDYMVSSLTVQLNKHLCNHTNSCFKQSKTTSHDSYCLYRFSRVRVEHTSFELSGVELTRKLCHEYMYGFNYETMATFRDHASAKYHAVSSLDDYICRPRTLESVNLLRIHYVVLSEIEGQLTNTWKFYRLFKASKRLRTKIIPALRSHANVLFLQPRFTKAVSFGVAEFVDVNRFVVVGFSVVDIFVVDIFVVDIFKIDSFDVDSLLVVESRLGFV
ncbi:hypothetical protein PHMEG_00010405 [Phytophthora megakarya]|uniref:Uncharacterized protein n=1 Tax=Phytophthora megakarya TaxID=4795 RepID=A0A225WDS1_9STRA|nr:hypothetical protein PHMEG_00010405 [Phytophthora megakarya]